MFQLPVPLIHGSSDDDDDMHRVHDISNQMETHEMSGRGTKLPEWETICLKTNYWRIRWTVARHEHTLAMPTTQQWHYVCFHHFSAQINISKLIKNFGCNWSVQCASTSACLRFIHLAIYRCPMFFICFTSSVLFAVTTRHPQNCISKWTRTQHAIDK